MFEDRANNFLTLGAELLNALRKIDTGVEDAAVFFMREELRKTICVSTRHSD